MVDEHVRFFPHDEGPIRAYFDLCREVHIAAHTLPPRLSISQLAEAAARHPRLFHYEKLTLAEVLDEYFVDPRLKAVLAGVWPYVGPPPSRMSFLTMAQTMMLIADGTMYCKGGFQAMVDALQSSFERQGGELLLNRSVQTICVENGEAVGVVLDHGLTIRASAVISNADARATFEKMVGPEHLPAGFLRKLRRMVPSMSAFLVFAATKADLSAAGIGHDTFLHDTFDHDGASGRMTAGHPGAIWLSVPSLADRTLAPEGENIVCMTAFVPYDIGRPWAQEEARFADEILAAVDAASPGLTGQLDILATATPETLERYAGNSQGAVHGWDNTPRQTGSRRLSRVTPVKHLYLAGHWTNPGSGSLRAMISGFQTATMMMEMAGMDAPHLDPGADIPPYR